ncbi:MAG TPA: hypothetical protein PLU49_04630, partial [Saprospiraceae bacterium]|nr:hypothetical protein [Saprospiraceae bacterium]
MNLKKIAVVSMARNDEFFADKWIDHYGKHLGEKNLYLILDGKDQVLPKKHNDINLIVKEHKPMSRAKGDKYRSGLVSSIAQDLMLKKGYDIIIAHDID